MEGEVSAAQGAVSSGAPAGAVLVVRTRYWGASFLLAAVETRLEVDGGPVAQRPWGETWWQLAPGPHQVRCSFPWMFYRRAGDTTVEVRLEPAQVVVVEYEAPRWFVFMKGTWTVHPPHPLPVPASAPAPDWYPDPSGTGQLRYWDGAQWTAHVHPPTA